MIVRAPSWEDVPAVLSLARAADVAVIGDSDWIESDLRAEWKQLDLEHDAWLVELDGALAGYATFTSRGGGRLLGDGYVHPDARGRGVGGELLRLTEDRARLELERIDPAARTVTLSGGEQVAWGALLLATGATPVRLPVPGAGLAHVFTLRSLRDSRAIIAAAGRAGRAVVVGASFIGLEVAAALRARRLEVHVVAPDRIPMERVLGGDLGAFVRALHEKNGVRFHLGSTVRANQRAEATLPS